MMRGTRFKQEQIIADQIFNTNLLKSKELATDQYLHRTGIYNVLTENRKGPCG
jgi:hypothetical protein